MSFVRRTRDIEKLAEECGIISPRIVRRPRGAHPRLTGEANGVPIDIPISGTPGDGHRGDRNLRAHLKRFVRGTVE